MPATPTAVQTSAAVRRVGALCPRTERQRVDAVHAQCIGVLAQRHHTRSMHMHGCACRAVQLIALPLLWSIPHVQSICYSARIKAR
jgi:hypothetical protein